MQTILDSGLLWWITVIDIPAMTALFYMNLRTRRDAERNYAHMREDISAFKLDVARNYAATSEMKDLELRIINHLLRIEQKLDKTALKTEGLLAKN